MPTRTAIILTAVCIAIAMHASHASEPPLDEDNFEVWETVEIGIPDSATIITHNTADTLVTVDDFGSFTILGTTEIDAETMWLFVKNKNPDFPREIAEAYHDLGRRYGIRGDVALCQAIIETGWFKFTDGTAVTSDQHNYCGLGVTKKGMRGSSFKSTEDGVRAQMQHLYAYACCLPLPLGEPLVDPRFNFVGRGCAPSWHDLSGRWAANMRYGVQIQDLYAQLCHMARSSGKYATASD